LTSNLKGRTALITGGSRGLGKSIAAALGSAGANVALAARDAAKLKEAAEELRSAGCEVEAFTVDVTNEEQVASLHLNVHRRFGPIHILANNAGINIRKQLHEFTLEEWNSVVNTNLTSAFLLSRACIPGMKEAGFGRIINLTSIMAHVSLPGRSAYSATKAGLLGMTKALALELAMENITVVAISPGPFATEMNETLLNNPELNRQFVSKIPVGAWGQVEDIGQLALFLCSDSAKFITGTDILIDGGWCAQ
jgi:NAD(P)-dependent dehydrogenase (short-subunit alcohol dehydrogenase family)